MGAWRIAALLGRGGMGEVWLAERADGAYGGEAAIKVLKRGMDSASVLARFALEQQALARLQHPHIARLLDAGRTADGLPYFVMERVSGAPIDQACAGLPLRERLRLFLQLAEAVGHAHRHLLVHRDLKPSNVLVDAEGQVKLLDFGIAKALDPLEGHDGLATVGGERAFTPHYASPEQVRGEPVTTATDIYSLGVLLCVLLTGRRPYRGAATTREEAARSALDESPTRPSDLVRPAPAAPAAAASSASPASPASTASTLSTASLPARALRGDLDTIVLKMLAKEPAARYASVEAVAADLRSHLAGRPISARPFTWRYVLGRLVARHRVAAAAIALGSLAAFSALAIALWQAQRAEHERQAAERRFVQVRQLARDLIFRYHDQIAALAGATGTREALLGDAVRFLDGLRAEGAAADPKLARETAEGYFRVAVLMGEQHSPSQERLREAASHLGKALELQGAYVGAGGIDAEGLFTASDMWLAQTSQQLRAARLGDALESLQRARRLAERGVSMSAPPATAGATTAIAGTPTPATANAAHAPATANGADATATADAADASAGTPAQGSAAARLQGLSRLATVEGRLGQLLGGTPIGANLGRTGQAEPHLRRSLALMQSLVQAEPQSAEWMHQAAWAHQNLVSLLVLTGRAGEALPLCEAMIALRDEAARRVPGNAHFRHQRGSVRASHAVVLAQLGRFREAMQVQAEVLAIMGATATHDAANRSASRDATLSLLAAGRIRAMAGERAQARALLERALAALPGAGDIAGSGDFYLARMRSEALLWLARALPDGEAVRAQALAGEARSLMAGSDDNAARRWTLAQALGEEAQALHVQGQREQARTVARQALAQWSAAPAATEGAAGSSNGAPAQYRQWQERAEALAR
ncbi:MAG: serine/threonine-protein kinase [Rubrivivax sp.]